MNLPLVAAIVRGDFRARIETSKGVRVISVFTALVCLATLLGIAPDLPNTQFSAVLTWISVAILVFVTYVASAVSSGEILIPGERTPADLATTAFTPRAIGLGKAASALVYVLLLVGVAAPSLHFAHALRGDGWSSALAQSAVIAAVAWGFAGIATFLGARIEGDLLRSLVLWALLGLTFGVLPFASATAFQPALAVAPRADALARWVCIVIWLALGVAGFTWTSRHILVLRRAS
ncbi:MAG: hypothetical protein FJX78_00360 [Armatimonadetes bacterium]|nr:hypothetical protein [Armatimonadota bacterium]